MNKYLKFEENGEEFYVKKYQHFIDILCELVYSTKADISIGIYKSVKILGFNFKIFKTEYQGSDLIEKYNIDDNVETYYVDCINFAIADYLKIYKEKNARKILKNKQEKKLKEYFQKNLKGEI